MASVKSDWQEKGGSSMILSPSNHNHDKKHRPPVHQNDTSLYSQFILCSLKS